MVKQNLAIAYEMTNQDISTFIQLIEKQKCIAIDEYLIFHKNLTFENKEKIRSVCKCKFIKINKVIKTKFEIFRYLKYYHRIIFTSLSNLITKKFIDEYSNYCFVCNSFRNTRFVEYNFKKLFSKYNMFSCSYDTSVLCIDDTLKQYKKIRNWCIFSSLKYYKYMENRIDATIDIMIQKFNIPVQFIKKEENHNNKDIYKINRKRIDKKVNGDLVSVLMCIYDREEYYKEAIKSILEQTYLNLELIIVVEFSEKQKKIVQNLRKIHDKRIVILQNKEKLGFAQSLNVGLQKVKGKFIARMDDDDICSFDRIEKEVHYFKQNPDVGIVGSFMKFFGQSDLVCKLPIDYEELKVISLFKTPLFHPTVMFNMNIVSKEDILYKNNIFAEDYDLWSRLIDKYKIYNIPEVLYFYRLNGENNSTSNENKMNESHHMIMKYQLKKFLDMELSYDELQLLSGRIDVLGFCKNREEIRLNKIQIWEKIKNKNSLYNFYREECINKILEKIRKGY